MNLGEGITFYATEEAKKTTVKPKKKSKFYCPSCERQEENKKERTIYKEDKKA
jgi:hypothetical protein